MNRVHSTTSGIAMRYKIKEIFINKFPFPLVRKKNRTLYIFVHFLEGLLISFQINHSFSSSKFKFTESWDYYFTQNEPRV